MVQIRKEKEGALECAAAGALARAPSAACGAANTHSNIKASIVILKHVRSDGYFLDYERKIGFPRFIVRVQGYLAHTKSPSFLGPP
jgi:hypothetical protein